MNLQYSICSIYKRWTNNIQYILYTNKNIFIFVSRSITIRQRYINTRIFFNYKKLEINEYSYLNHKG